jgi:hypothetical protein
VVKSKESRGKDDVMRDACIAFGKPSATEGTMSREPCIAFGDRMSGQSQNL